MQIEKDQVEKLSKIEIFSDLSPTASEDKRILEELASLLSEKKFKKGEMIIREGDMGDTLYILASGSVQVLRNTLGDEKYAVVNLKAEQNVFFGEVALIDSDRRSASVMALEDCKTWILTLNDYEKICEREPRFGYLVTFRIAKRIASTLRNTNNDIITLYEALLDEVEGKK
jgi:CRP-like cAMP-binding protein